MIILYTHVLFSNCTYIYNFNNLCMVIQKLDWLLLCFGCHHIMLLFYSYESSMAVVTRKPTLVHVFEKKWGASRFM